MMTSATVLFCFYIYKQNKNSGTCHHVIGLAVSHIHVVGTLMSADCHRKCLLFKVSLNMEILHLPNNNVHLYMPNSLPLLWLLIDSNRKNHKVKSARFSHDSRRACQSLVFTFYFVFKTEQFHHLTPERFKRFNNMGLSMHTFTCI